MSGVVGELWSISAGARAAENIDGNKANGMDSSSERDAALRDVEKAFTSELTGAERLCTRFAEAAAVTDKNDDKRVAGVEGARRLALRCRVQLFRYHEVPSARTSADRAAQLRWVRRRERARADVRALGSLDEIREKFWSWREYTLVL